MESFFSASENSDIEIINGRLDDQTGTGMPKKMFIYLKKK